jgi:CRISPR-associated endonuclease Cas1
MIGLAEIYTDEVEYSGVCVVDGYGLRVLVDHGHLVVRDGIGRHRRDRRFAKVGHKLSRLVVLGHSGTVSLEALRWMDRTGITFAQIDTDGAVLTTSANPGLNDPRLRRAQVLAGTSPSGIAVARSLIGTKLAGQGAVAAEQLNNAVLAEAIEVHRQAVEHARSIEEIRGIEAKAARDYFEGWSDVVEITWAGRDRSAVPEHWRSFDARRSPISTTSARRAADPVNALLNYLYALAEVECRRACLTLGLDPGLGIVHADTRGRDSLALDLIETVRPEVEAYVLDLLEGHVFRRVDFHETDDGHCRILAPLTHHLADSLDQWRAVVAPIAEQVAHALADASPHPIAKPTPLTSARRGAARPKQKSHKTGPLGPVCKDCGAAVASSQRRYCPGCWPAHRTDNGLAGSTAAQAQLRTPRARELKAETVRTGKAAAKSSRATGLGWSEQAWDSTIAPRLAEVTTRQIAEATGLSIPYANRIRRGTQVPDPRHWQALADLTRRH